jgi:hypothetical protein
MRSTAAAERLWLCGVTVERGFPSLWEGSLSPPPNVFGCAASPLSSSAARFLSAVYRRVCGATERKTLGTGPIKGLVSSETS